MSCAPIHGGPAPALANLAALSEDDYLVYTFCRSSSTASTVCCCRSWWVSTRAALYYVVRLVSYGLILAAIILKNRGSARRE